MHEVESRTRKITSASDEVICHSEAKESLRIIGLYCLCIEYAVAFKNQRERKLTKQWEEAYQDIALDAMTITEQAKTLGAYKAKAEETFMKIKN